MIRIQAPPSALAFQIADTALTALWRVVVRVARLRSHPMVLLALSGSFIEALLGMRLWVQLSSRPNSGLTAVLMDVTDELVSPFRGMDGVAPIKQTGILEFATLAAIEAYLVIGLALVLLFFAAGQIVRDISPIVSRKHHRTTQRSVARTAEPASRQST